MKIAICDDEMQVARTLHSRLHEIPGTSISRCAVYEDPEKLLFEIDSDHFDMIFMDIKLNERSGIEIAERILKADPAAQIIFMSAYDEYYLDVYKVPHCYFLKKPFDNRLLKEAVDMAASRINEMEEDYITFTKRHTAVRIPVNSILYMEKNLRIIHIHLKDMINSKNLIPAGIDGEYIYKLYGKFDQLLPKMNGAFHQCHTSFVINFNHVSEMMGKSFIMDNGEEIPISEKYYYQIKTEFFRFIQGEL